MTTIAYRDGVIAADTQAESAGKIRVAKKLYRIDGKIVGITGNYMDGLTFVQWVEAGMNVSAPPTFITYGRSGDEPDFSALVLSRDDCVHWTEHFQPMPILDEFWALGSGSMAAMAAMHMGASAKRAIQIAMKIDPATGGEIEIEGI